MNNSDSQELHQVGNDPAYLVVRNEEHSHQGATVSFGGDWTGSKYVKPVDVVNYYRPNPKNQVYLPENSFFNSNGKVRAHMGGESTYRGDSYSNRNKQVTTHTNNYSFEQSFGDVESVDSDKDTVVPEARAKGLFEVPLDVYSMPRLIAPFKGFSKIVTPRAVKLLTFTEDEEGKLLCKVDKGAVRTLQKQVGDLNVVSVSFTGDPKSGKSFLASLLVGRDNTSFTVSESFIDPNNMLTQGQVWVYLAVYQDKNAYVFLDFHGLEHSEKSMVKMLLFAYAFSNAVFCNVKYSLMTGIHNAVQSMVQLTKKQTVNVPLGEEELMDKEESEFLEILKDRGSQILNTSYVTKQFNELKDNCEDKSEGEVETRELWKAPIVQFVFRDCSGFVKCIDDRIFTPETLVEQGIFENYLDIFSPHERDPKFMNEMLDAFEVFTNRKYSSLPHPTLSTHPYLDNEYPEDEGLNITDFFMKLLSTDKNDFKKFTKLGYDNFNLNTKLSSVFYEKLDHLKSVVYHDTLNYAMAHSRLNGRMFAEYLKKLAHHFNKNNSFTVDDLNKMLSSVFLGENSNVLKESLLHFLRQIRADVAPKIPMDSKTLLNLVISCKFTSLKHFESKAFGTPEEYRRQFDELSDTLEDLVRKLEEKNKALLLSQMATFVEMKEANIRANIHKGSYSIKRLDEDLLKLKESLNSKFSDPDLISKVLSRASQNLVRVFNDTHPETFIHNLTYSKSSSIEETFENLNNDIKSMTSFLHMPQVKGPPAYPGADDEMTDSEEDLSSEQSSDKFNRDLEDNNLEQNFRVEEDAEDDVEYSKEDNEFKKRVKKGDQEEEDLESEEDEDLEDESDEDEEGDDQDEDEDEKDNDEEDEEEEENDDDNYSRDFESVPWILGGSGGTGSFRGDSLKLSQQNSEAFYEEDKDNVDKDDELVMVQEDDFAQEPMEDSSDHDDSDDDDNGESDDRDKDFRDVHESVNPDKSVNNDNDNDNNDEYPKHNNDNDDHDNNYHEHDNAKYPKHNDDETLGTDDKDNDESADRDETEDTDESVDVHDKDHKSHFVDNFDDSTEDKEDKQQVLREIFEKSARDFLESERLKPSD